MRLWVGHNPPYSGPRMLVGSVLRTPAPLRRAIVCGGRPALRPFAAAPRPVASARRPAPRAPLRVHVLSVVGCGVRRLCGVRRFFSIVVGSVAVLGAPRCPSALRALARMSDGPRCAPLPAPALRRPALSVGAPPACPSWARFARSALNGHAWGAPSLSAWP